MSPPSSSATSTPRCARASRISVPTSGGLFNEEDLMAAGEELDPDSSAALLVWENVWAKPVAAAIRDAGGELYDYDRIPHEVVVAAREWAQANA